MKRAFVDTSAWFAYVNRADREHQRIQDAFEAFDGRLLTSNYVLDETVTLCLYRLGHRAAVTVGNTIRNSTSIDLVGVTPDDENNAWSLFESRGDQNYSFTDCTSFTLMRRLQVDLALALDEDFANEGFKVLPAG